MQKHWEVTAIWRSGFPSTVYMWTVNIVRASKRPSEMFQTLMEKAYYGWNVFLGAPDILCECWKIWGIFVFVYIKRRVNKETVSICSLLGVSVAVHKRELVCAKKKKKRQRNCLAKKLWRFDNKEERFRIPFTSPRIYISFWYNSSHTWHVHSARLINFSH